MENEADETESSTDYKYEKKAFVEEGKKKLWEEKFKQRNWWNQWLIARPRRERERMWWTVWQRSKIFKINKILFYEQLDQLM